jgi:ribosomal protein L37AE/L43A
MSTARRFRRRLPDHVRAAFASQKCPDCDSGTTDVRRRDGIWQADISHDDGCVQLAWRERHGALTTYAITTGEPGKTVPADLVGEVAGILADQPGCVGVRVSDQVALSRSERERIDEALS